MKQTLGYVFVALALLALLFNAYLVFKYCRIGKGSSPIALLVAAFGTLAVLCFKGTGFAATSYVVIFAGLFFFSILICFPMSYFCSNRGIQKGSDNHGSPEQNNPG